MKILNTSPCSAPGDLGQLAQDKLHQSPYFFLRRLTCHFDSGVLTLRGRVPYGQLKQLAEAIVARIDGVEEVVNRIEVVDPARGYANAVRNAG
jgi:osmotically-inducible protein OsmY